MRNRWQKIQLNCYKMFGVQNSLISVTMHLIDINTTRVKYFLDDFYAL